MTTPGGLLLVLGTWLASCTSVSAPPELPVASTRSKDGASIVYESGGTGATTLVFVHGWCCDRSFWHTTAAAFSRDYRVAALDLAGHGSSPASRTEWPLSSLADDVGAGVDAAG